MPADTSQALRQLVAKRANRRFEHCLLHEDDSLLPHQIARLVRICEDLGNYCLIGGMAVNCYVEPVYTVGTDLVIFTPAIPALLARLTEAGFAIESFPHSINALIPGSDLRVQFTTDAHYPGFSPSVRKNSVPSAVPFR